MLAQPSLRAEASYRHNELRASSEWPHLVNDSRARLPEADAVLGTGSGQEIVHLNVGLDGVLEISHTSEASLPVDQKNGFQRYPHIEASS